MSGNPPSTKQYINNAHCAVRYVKCKVQSHDSLKDIYRHGIIGNIYYKTRLEKMRRIIEDRAKKRGIIPHSTIGTDKTWRWYIIQMAYMAEKWGVGNCGEQAAVAFVYLAKWIGVRPLDYVCLKRPRDHAFVVLGSPVRIRTNNFKEWQERSVICDPWNNWVGLGKTLPIRYSPNLVESKLRLE